MKNIFAILSLLILASLSPANAFGVEVKGSQMAFNDSEMKAGPAYEIKVKADELYYLYLSEERLRIFGDCIRLNAIGIGAEYPVIKRFFFYGQVGYYRPDYKEDQFSAESLWFYQCKYLSGVYEPVWWDRYVANWESDIGGEIGIDYRQQIYQRISLGFSLGYRYLRLNETVTSYQKSGADAWYVFQSRDFGGFRMGFQISYGF